jgi:hypothetical protein
MTIPQPHCAHVAAAHRPVGSAHRSDSPPERGAQHIASRRPSSSTAVPAEPTRLGDYCRSTRAFYRALSASPYISAATARRAFPGALLPRLPPLLMRLLLRRALSAFLAAHFAHSIRTFCCVLAVDQRPHSTDNRRRGRWMQRRTAPLLLHSDDRPADASVAAGHRTRTDCGLLRHRSVSPFWKGAPIEAARRFGRALIEAAHRSGREAHRSGVGHAYAGQHMGGACGTEIDPLHAAGPYARPLPMVRGSPIRTGALTEDSPIQSGVLIQQLVSPDGRSTDSLAIRREHSPQWFTDQKEAISIAEPVSNYRRSSRRLADADGALTAAAHRSGTERSWKRPPSEE